MPVETPGIRGELVWSDIYKSHVAYYPPECLPSQYTIYYSSFGWSPPTQPYTFPVGGTPFGTGIAIGLFPFGLITPDVIRWVSTHRHIFAQCDYRINEPIVLTNEMIQNDEIELAEHIFEMAAATVEKIPSPPWISSFPDYTINIYGMSADRTMTFQFDLVWETAVEWSITGINTTYTGFLSEVIGIDSETGLFSIEPALLGVRSVSVTIKATNSLGQEHSRTVKFEVIREDGTPELQSTTVDEEVPTRERLEDMLWRRIFDERHLIEDNLFKEIIGNDLGVYYRMDNGKPKSLEIAQQSSVNVSYGPSHQDASSRKFRTESLAGFNVGDVLYVTYVAVKEHYLRQVAVIQWFAIDAGYLGFIAYPVSISGANYRFYKWELPGTVEGEEGITEVEGWRIVESFNYEPRLLGVITQGREVPEIADFFYDTKGSGRPIQYLDPGRLTNEVLAAMENENLLDSYSILADGNSDQHNYTRITFPEGIPPSWYETYLTSLNSQSYSDMNEHLIYNVHPVALRTRDVDKIGYHVSLAEAIEETVNSGDDLLLPYLDSPGDINPTWRQTFSTTIDSSNFKIEPIDSVPRIINTSNASHISSPIGLFPRVGAGYVYGEFQSNVIREQFKKGTKILVETKPLGQKGTVILSVKCKATAEGFVTCVRDPGFKNILVYSNNPDGFLIRRNAKYEYFDSDLAKVIFQPNEGGIDYEEVRASIAPSTYPVVGLAGLIGDSPGMFPGRVVSFYKYAHKEAFIEYYSHDQQTNIETARQITATQIEGDILIPLGQLCYTGSLHVSLETVLKFRVAETDQDRIREMIDDAFDDLSEQQTGETLILFTSGNNVESAIDRVPTPLIKHSSRVTRPPATDPDTRLKVNLTVTLKVDFPDYYWLKGDTIRIKVPGIDITPSLPGSFERQDISTQVKDISIIGIQDKYAQDFTELDADPNFLTPNFPLWKGADFIKTDYASAYVAETGKIYVIFSDENDGISSVYTSDEGITWNLQYGLIPQTGGKSTVYPFILRSSSKEEFFLFFIRDKVLYVSTTPVEEMRFEDNFTIKEPPEEEEEREQDDFFKRVRDSHIYVAAGNNNAENIQFIQETPRFRLGKTTVFRNVNFETPFFSAYQNNEGELRVIFIDGNGKLQCHYSCDNGMNWNDLWVCMKYGQEGIVEDLDQFGQTSTEYRLGINPHPTVLATDTQIESPYAFHSSSNQVYLFYIYKECLLCKIFVDPESCQIIRERNNYDEFERSISQAPSLFVDGNVSKIEDELDLNVTMKHRYATAVFGESRAISAQRVCAIELRNGCVKIFYKTADGGIRSAWQDGFAWVVEDMMRPSPDDEEE